MSDPTRMIPVPVTILTGFLGAGKTTLLNRILTEEHGQRIAIIENEFGEEGIDNDLLFQSKEQIVEMNNGCICCTVRGDLVRILGELAEKREQGQIHFERVIIETTGLADPAPVAQTFFIEEAISEHYLLDGIIAVIDAKHGLKQLDEHHEAQEQVGFADRLLISKTDLVDADTVNTLQNRLRGINVRAPISQAHFGIVDIEEILDIRCFNLNAILEIEPDFLDDVSHEHDNDISSFVYRTNKALDSARIMKLMQILIRDHGNDLLRYKGILNISGCNQRVIYQGVHMLFTEDFGKPWETGEIKESVLVFIGRNLPKEEMLEALDSCKALLRPQES